MESSRARVWRVMGWGSWQRSYCAPSAPSLPSSGREELRNLFQCRAKLPPVCRALAGLEGTSQQALQRGCILRRTFARSLAAVKRKAACSQVQLQMVRGAFVIPSWSPVLPVLP